MWKPLALFACLLLGACGTTEYAMPYTAGAEVRANRAPGPIARVATVSNMRVTGGEDPVWIGTVRGGFGNPLMTLNADRPVDQLLQRAFDDALAARGWLAAGAPRVDVEITVTEFFANRYARMEATAGLELVLRDRGSRRVLWEDQETVNNVAGSAMSMEAGVFADPAALQALMLRTMNQAIDRLLDKPGFAAALVAASPPPAPPRRPRAVRRAPAS